MTDIKALTPKDATRDAVEAIVRQAFEGRDNTPTDEQIGKEVDAILAATAAHNAWRQSLPMDQQLALTGTPAVNPHIPDVDPANPEAPSVLEGDGNPAPAPVSV